MQNLSLELWNFSGTWILVLGVFHRSFAHACTSVFCDLYVLLRPDPFPLRLAQNADKTQTLERRGQAREEFTKVKAEGRARGLRASPNAYKKKHECEFSTPVKSAAIEMYDH
jgi:hypothetical protein